VLHLPSTTSTQVIQRLKATLSWFGIPNEHITFSPHHPQGKGLAERAVETAKRIIRQEDPLIVLMSYRSTASTTTGVSPAELLTGRKIKTTLPTLEKNLRPKWPNRETVKQKDADRIFTKLDQEKAWTIPAVVSKECMTPRSYLINTPQGGVLWGKPGVDCDKVSTLA
uniref:Integrase catalytic domain-containing protein n=1 Tax=Mola mola TaxID=94237 RepID=A0A3Q3WX37_MOLML